MAGGGGENEGVASEKVEQMANPCPLQAGLFWHVGWGLGLWYMGHGTWGRGPFGTGHYEERVSKFKVTLRVGCSRARMVLAHCLFRFARHTSSGASGGARSVWSGRLNESTSFLADRCLSSILVQNYFSA